MALIQLRRKIFPNALSGAPFYAQLVYWDSDTRTPYRTQVDSQLNDPAELAKDTVVDRFAVRPGKELVVRYNGKGSVYTARALGAVTSDVRVKLGLLPAYTSSAGAADACVDITGQYGLPPYLLTLRGLSGAATGYLNTAVPSVSELFPVRFYNLKEGNYEATVLDQLGNAQSQLLTVTAGQGYPRGVGLQEVMTAVQSVGFQWRYNNQDIVALTYGPKVPSLYQLPYGQLVDGYLYGTNSNWRRVYSDGVGGVYYTDQLLTDASTLALDNLIVFHPDTPAEQNGGLVVEMRADHQPLTYQLSDSGGVVTTNQTGHFDSLPAATYTVLVTDPLGATITVSYELKDRYGKRWLFEYSDAADVPCRLELWTAGYTGAVEPIIGQDDPVVLNSDGLSSSIGGQGDIGPVVATSADLNLKVTTETFEEIITSDRYCRADWYYDNQLYFRGFVEASTYDAPLLPGLQPVHLTATDGLSGLKDLNMTGHEGQRLLGHRPWLNTLLHCLSRCDVSLPVRIYTNRRDEAMADDEAPEQAATSNRTGYYDEEKKAPLTQRATIEAVAQAAGGTLVQRAGAWEIRNILEAAEEAEGRAYLPAGTPLPAVSAPAPTANVLPPTRGLLHWDNRSQAMQIRAGWKSLTGQTDVGYLKNAYPAGQVFSDENAWLDDQRQLLPASGWRPLFGVVFPLVFGQLGEKGTDYTTRWPRSSSYATLTPSQYLQGPALPLAPGHEAVPAALTLTGRLVPEEYYLDGDGKQVVAPTNAQTCVLSYELVVDGQAAGVQQAIFELADSDTAKDSVVSIPLPELPTGAVAAELRLYSWYAADTGLLDSAPVLSVPGLQVFKTGETLRYDFGTGTYRLFVARQDMGLGVTGAIFFAGNWADYFTELTATNRALGKLYLSEVGVQLTPQNATWEGEDNFRADAAGGSIRPTDALDVFHADVPLPAGLYGGNLHAFAKAVGLADGTLSTSWRRAIDLDAAPLFEANIYDGLALRDGPSRLLTGTLMHKGTAPVLLLDTLDLPYEPSGVRAHRFCVCSTVWHTKHAKTEVSLVQNGLSALAPDPYDFEGKVLIVDSLYAYAPGQYVPYALGTDDGSLLSWE
ncbi:MAG: hypothetical protein ACRYFZ_03660 [Janthinobacterium lividum]